MFLSIVRRFLICLQNVYNFDIPSSYMNDTVIIESKKRIKRSERIMKKRKYLYLCINIAFLWIAGCTTKNNLESIIPSPTIEVKENESTKIQEPVFKEKEEKKEEEEKTSSKKIITKTDGLCEILEEVEIEVETYNRVNRMLGRNVFLGFEGFSLFCMDESTGVIYFVNQGKDNFLYRMKDGEVKLAVAMPVKQIYPYEDSIYFMIYDYEQYELQGMQNGDIYCYTPETGAVELIYAVGTIEGSVRHKLLVEESGIYFSYKVFAYSVEEGDVYDWFSYYLPFGATEYVEDTRWTVRKGTKDYYVGIGAGVVLYSREMKEDGTRETIQLPVSNAQYCFIGNYLYSAEKTGVSCTNLETKETILYDFSEAMAKWEVAFALNKEEQYVQWFTMTEDALWVTTGERLYRMDLQTGKITYGKILIDNSNPYYYYTVPILYTDGKDVYGKYTPKPFTFTSGAEAAIVRLVTDSMDDTGTAIVEMEYLTE